MHLIGHIMYICKCMLIVSAYNCLLLTSNLREFKLLQVLVNSWYVRVFSLRHLVGEHLPLIVVFICISSNAFWSTYFPLMLSFLWNNWWVLLISSRPACLTTPTWWGCHNKTPQTGYFSQFCRQKAHDQSVSRFNFFGCLFLGLQLATFLLWPHTLSSHLCCRHKLLIL